MQIDRIITEHNRADLVRAVEAAPLGAHFQLIDAPRTTAQNRLLWKLLTIISDQVIHCGNRYEPECWKAAFLKGIGERMTFMPGIDDDGGVVACGYKSSRLSKEKFSDLIESIYEYGARNGVRFDSEQVA